MNLITKDDVKAYCLTLRGNPTVHIVECEHPPMLILEVHRQHRRRFDPKKLRLMLPLGTNVRVDFVSHKYLEKTKSLEEHKPLQTNIKVIL